MRISVTSLVFLFLTATILSACGLWSEPPPGAIQPVPEYGKVIDPDDTALTQAIAEFVKKTEAPASTGYNYVRHDLNDDGRRDALVYLKSPYGYWCGTHGCAILVFQAHNDRFTLVNAIQPVRGPVHISVMKSNGWKNLVVRVSGRSNKAKDVAMLFDGKQYPSDPSNLPPFPKKNYNGYTRVFMRD